MSTNTLFPLFFLVAGVAFLLNGVLVATRRENPRRVLGVLWVGLGIALAVHGWRGWSG